MEEIEQNKLLRQNINLYRNEEEIQKQQGEEKD